MIWKLNEHSYGDKDGYAFYFQPVDGNFGKVRLLDETVDIGKWEIPSTDYFNCGRHVQTEHLPRKIYPVYGRTDTNKHLVRGKAQLPGFTRLHGANLVSDEFRRVIEKFDPGVHQFVPVSIEWADGDVEAVPYFWFAVGKRLFALDPEKTQPPVAELPDGPGWVRPDPSRPAFIFDTRVTPTKWAPVLRSEVVRDSDVFCTAEMEGHLLVTDRVKVALEETGMRGLHFMGPYQFS